MPALPPAMRQLLAPFASRLARRVWHRALVPVAGCVGSRGHLYQFARFSVCAMLDASPDQ